MEITSKTNILVTGADGFIGSHLTESLLEKGLHVRALSQYNSFNNWGWLEDIPKNNNLEIVSGDIRDPFFCKEITKNIDLVFHLAALISIPYSYIAPESYIETNVKGTLNICHAANENNVSRVIHTSTSEVYGTAMYVPIDENHPKQPQSPYSASKIGADAIALSFYNTFDLPITIARPFNTYGPRQSARAVIPSIIIQIASGKKKIELGDIRPTRDFNYVKDICSGFIAIAKSVDTIGKEVNIASNFEISIENTFNLLLGIMNSDAFIVNEKNRLRPINSEVQRLWGDNTLIKNLTDFIPNYSFEKGLEETVAWYTQPTVLKKYKPDIYNI
jgi:NAD dependent epimerase/dehydratase